MSLNEFVNLYDVLEILPNASPQEVREAYVRTRSTYNRGNVALYTIVSAEEREEILKKIEEAYFVLSDPERRRAYDSNTGILGIHDSPFIHDPEPDPLDKIVSIDRVPPMENTSAGDDILIPPSTDFTPPPTESAPSETLVKAAPASPEKPPLEPPPIESQSSQKSKKNSMQVSDSPKSNYRMNPNQRSFLPKLDMNLTQEIELETEWKGSFLKKIREAYKISLEEMISTTKVSKTYILAIEDENFAKLPAPVYIRGFVTQIAKVLKLPHDKVANAYLNRYRQKVTAE